MQKFVVGVLLVLSQITGFAQGPRVPSKMSIGDMRIKITDGARAEIQKNVDDLTRHPKYFNAKVDLANQYFHFIEEAFRKEGVPEEIKYLVIQESGLQSDAVSTSNAVGYWQFKDFTAVEMGLRVDRHVDERKNIYAASIGAAKYMKMNNGYFDNWIYAIQAYQMGAGGALKVTDKKLYGSKQMTITKKTYWYVKKYLAHKVAYESAVGISKPSVYLSAYKSAAGKSLQEVADKFKVDQDELKKYNKWLHKGKVPHDKKYAVIIPDKKYIIAKEDNDIRAKSKSVLIRKAPTYNQAQAKLFPKIKPWKGSHKYSGSTVNINRIPGVIADENSELVDLARKGNLSLGDFLSINDVEIDHRVIPGVVYYFKRKKPKAKVYYHVVHSGESLWSISQKYGVQLKKLLLKNRMTERLPLKEGRVLWMRHIRPENIAIAYEEVDDPKPIEIPINVIEENHIIDSSRLKPVKLSEVDTLKQKVLEKVEEFDSAKYKEVVHLVQKGDTYYNIANRYNTEVLELIKWNGLKLSDKLSIGQQLKILILLSQDGATEIEYIKKDELQEYHVVEKGETLFSISSKYGLTIQRLKLLNEKTYENISIGERLKISGEK